MMTPDPRGDAEEQRSVRVVVAEDSEVVRATLVELISEVPQMQVVGVAADGAEAVDIAVAEHADVLLTDLRMSGADGVHATRSLASLDPSVKVIVLSAYGEQASVVDALVAGARGYLLKGCPPEEIIEAVEAVARGEAYFSPEVRSFLLERSIESLKSERQARAQAEEARATLEDLHRRQLEFAREAAHELRTPLTSLLGGLRLLEDRPTGTGDEEGRELLGMAIRQVGRLRELSSRLETLAIHRAPRGEELRGVELRGLLETVAQKFGLGSGVPIKGPGKVFAHGDPASLTTALNDLILNISNTGPSPIQLTEMRVGVTGKRHGRDGDHRIDDRRSAGRPRLGRRDLREESVGGGALAATRPHRGDGGVAGCARRRRKPCREAGPACRRHRRP